MTVAVSVITATRNRAHVLARCLEALDGQTLDPSRYEVLVADDASTDGTPAVVETAQARARCAIRFSRLDRRSGVPAARNAAILAARGEIVVFVDDDSLAPPGFLAAHLDAHTAHRDAIVCRGPVIVTQSLDRPFDVRGGVLDISTAYFDTDNGSVRREDLLRAGLFDEAFSPYGWEGLDLGFRLRSLGLRRVFRRDAALYHYRPEVSPGTLDAMLVKEEERARTARVFYAKHPTLEARFAVQLTPLHLLLNLLQRGFGLVHARNVESLVERTRRWGIPAVGRVLLSGVLNERYLAELWACGNSDARAANGP
ncbi:MAG TPA: glycosyltransferase [bacterium]|nr:glycosyltransferase [bacterium]